MGGGDKYANISLSVLRQARHRKTADEGHPRRGRIAASDLLRCQDDSGNCLSQNRLHHPGQTFLFVKIVSMSGRTSTGRRESTRTHKLASSEGRRLSIEQVYHLSIELALSYVP
jgi:hypothetical protein